MGIHACTVQSEPESFSRLGATNFLPAENTGRDAFALDRKRVVTFRGETILFEYGHSGLLPVDADDTTTIDASPRYLVSLTCGAEAKRVRRTSVVVMRMN